MRIGKKIFFIILIIFATILVVICSLEIFKRIDVYASNISVHNHMMELTEIREVSVDRYIIKLEGFDCEI